MSSVQDINTIRASAEQQANTVFTASGSSTVPAIKVEAGITHDNTIVKTEPVDDTTGAVEDTTTNATTDATTSVPTDTPISTPIDAPTSTPANASASTLAGKLQGFYNARGDFEMLYVQPQPPVPTSGKRHYRSFKRPVEESGTNRLTGKKMIRSTEPSDKYIQDMGKDMPSGITDRLAPSLNDASAASDVGEILGTIATDTATYAAQTALNAGTDESTITNELMMNVAATAKAAVEAQNALDAHMAKEAPKKGRASSRPQKKIASTNTTVPATPSRVTRASASRLSGSDANDAGTSNVLSSALASGSSASDAFLAPATPASKKRKASVTKPAPETPTPAAPKRTRSTAQLDSPDETSPEEVTPPTPTPSRKKLKLNVSRPPTPESVLPKLRLNVSKSPTPVAPLPKLKLKRNASKATDEVQQAATPESGGKSGSATDATHNKTAVPSTPAPARHSARATRASQAPGGYGGDDSDSDDDDDKRKKLPSNKRDSSPISMRRAGKRKQEDDDDSADDNADDNASDDAPATPSPAKKARFTPSKAPATPTNKKARAPRTTKTPGRKTPGVKKDGSAKKTPKETIPKSYEGAASQKGYSIPAPDVPGVLDTPWRCGNLGCTSGMTWLPRDADASSGEGACGRKVISQFFGRNKAATKLIPDSVWHYYCRKDYQRQTYDAKKDSKDHAAFNIAQIREQISRLELYRPDAMFDVALTKGALDRVFTFQALKSANNNDATIATSLMPPPKKAGDLTLEEAMPPSVLEKFYIYHVTDCKIAAGRPYDYDGLERVLQFIEREIAADTTNVMIPFEFLIHKPVDGETIDETDNFEKWRCIKQNITYPDMS